MSKAEERELHFSFPTGFSPSFWPIMSCLSALVVGFVYWSFYAAIPINIEARGVVISLSGLREISSNGSGQVAYKNKNSGDNVAVGELILSLSNPAEELKLDLARRLYLSQIALLNQRKKSAIEAMNEEIAFRETERKAIAMELERIKEIQENMSTAMKALSDTNIVSSQRKVILGKKLLEGWEAKKSSADKLLSGGNISSTENLRIYDAYINRVKLFFDAKIEETSSYVEHERQRYELNELIAQVDRNKIELLKAHNAINEKKRKYEVELSSIEEEKTDAINILLEKEYVHWLRTVVISPYNGRILTVKKSLGQAFSEGEPLSLIELNNQSQMNILVLSDNSHNGFFTLNIQGDKHSVEIMDGNFSNVLNDLKSLLTKLSIADKINIDRHGNRFIISGKNNQPVESFNISLESFEIYDENKIPVYAAFNKIGEHFHTKEWVNLALVSTKDSKRIIKGTPAFIRPDSEFNLVGAHIESKVLSVDQYFSTITKVESIVGSSEISQAISDSGTAGVALLLSLENVVPSPIGLKEKNNLKFPISQGSTTTSYIQVGEASPIEIIIPFLSQLAIREK